MSPRAAALGLLVVCAALAAASAEDTKTDAGLEKRVDAVVAKQVQPGGAGCAVGIVVSGQVVLRKGYGFASIESKTAIGPGSLFDLASCSKAFTAAAIEILAERKLLSYDDEVSKHLPELKDKNPKRPLRIRDLLHHNSALVEYTDKVDRIKTMKQVLDLAASRRTRKLPGQEHEYCNTNYSLLGLIIERTSKKSYREFLTAEVFGPLGMKATDVLDATTPPLEDRVTGYKRVHRGKPARRSWVPSKLDTPGLVGDGGVFSSIDDLVKWDAGLAAAKLVKPETLALAHASGKLDSGEETGYGFGWAVGESNGRRYAEHTGGWMGTSTFVCRYLDHGVTVIVLSNDEDLEAGALGAEIAAEVLR